MASKSFTNFFKKFSKELTSIYIVNNFAPHISCGAWVASIIEWRVNGLRLAMELFQGLDTVKLLALEYNKIIIKQHHYISSMRLLLKIIKHKTWIMMGGRTVLEKTQGKNQWDSGCGHQREGLGPVLSSILIKRAGMIAEVDPCFPQMLVLPLKSFEQYQCHWSTSSHVTTDAWTMNQWRSWVRLLTQAVYWPWLNFTNSILLLPV